jgi:hypothetical protein
MTIKNSGVNARYSQNVVTEAQRGHQIIGGEDNSAFDAWEKVEQVQNAHVQQGAPTRLYEAPLDIDSVNRPSTAPVADYQDDYTPDVEDRTFSTYGFPQGGPAQPAVGGVFVGSAGPKRKRD